MDIASTALQEAKLTQCPKVKALPTSSKQYKFREFLASLIQMTRYNLTDT